MKHWLVKSHKSKAQGMVEFALVLPLLLVLLFGIIEVGRLFVIYASVSTASREGARYASAAGHIDPNNLASPYYYLDTAGIRASARRVLVLIGVPDENIIIHYDTGPGTACYTPTGMATITGCPTERTVRGGDRVVVQVNAQYEPLLGLVPGLHSLPIQADATRTIVKEVGIDFIKPAGNPPVLTITSPANGATFNYGDTITFSGTATDEDGDLSSEIIWTADGVQFFIGASIDISGLQSQHGVEEVIIVAQVTDSQGNKKEASIIIYIVGDTPPLVTIVSPDISASVMEGTEITLSATATDSPDGTISLFVWTVDGNLVNGGTPGNGIPISTAGWSIGDHTITATATDSTGQQGSATVTIRVTLNTPPTIVITSPGNDARFPLYATINFAATATDAEEPGIGAKIIWNSSLNGDFSSGASVSTAGLGEGTHTITASVTDSGGKTASASITIYVINDQPPVVTIVAPTSGSMEMEGTSISFSGTALDAKDGDISGSLTWYSSINGSIGTGASFSTSSLSVGFHTITAQAVDTSGLTGTASITIRVFDDSPPTVLIYTPSDGASINEHFAVAFSGSANDTKDGDLSASLSWETSTGVKLGTGPSFSYSNLTSGTYTIIASVTDKDGRTGSASITLIIVGNLPPVVTISSPGDGTSVKEGTSILFVGSALDAVDGDLSPYLAWSSDLDGPLNNGNTTSSFSTADLSVGNHTITAKVTDSGQLVGSASIVVVITNPCRIDPGTARISGNTITWTLVNNATISYRLIKLTVPWTQGEGQKLETVNFGTTGTILLWQKTGQDNSVGSTYGPVGSVPAPEWGWDVTRAQHIFPDGPGLQRPLSLIFAKDIQTNSVAFLTAVFLNIATGDQCGLYVDVTY